MGISDGLTAAYLFNNTGTIAKDYSGNGHDIALTGTSWVAGGLQCSQANHYGVISDGSSVFDVENCTIVISYKSLSAITDGEARVLVGNYVDFNRFHMGKFGDNVFYITLRDFGGDHFISYNSNKFANWETGIYLGCQFCRNSAIYSSKSLALYIDDGYVTPDGSSGADYVPETPTWNDTPIASTMAILNEVGFYPTRFANGVAEYLYVFNTIKTADELAAIKAAPISVVAHIIGANTSGIGVGVGCGL